MGEVYKQLEPEGLTVVGGRVSDVGVGGFMLGGESIDRDGTEEMSANFLQGVSLSFPDSTDGLPITYGTTR